MEDQLNSTYFAKKEDYPDEERDWFLVDAGELVLGRLASRIATILKGKHKPEYTPHVDTGDHVIVRNAENVRVSGKKEIQKVYENFSGFPSGKKEIVFEKMKKNNPDRIIERAVFGMLPNNPLGEKMEGKLHVYTGTDHPHEAQQPEEIQLKEIV